VEAFREVGPEMPERGSKNINGASRQSNVWNFFVRHDPNDFLSRLVTMDETWLYHYDPETKNNHWTGGIAAHPAAKNFRVQKSVGKFFVSIFLGLRRHAPH